MNGTEKSSTVRDLWLKRHTDSGLGAESNGRPLDGFMVEVVKIRAPPRQRHDIAKMCCLQVLWRGGYSAFSGGLGTVRGWAQRMAC